MKTLHIFLIVAFIVIVAFFLGRCSGEAGITKVDTSFQHSISYEVIRDTVIGKPQLVFVNKPVIKTIYERDTLLIPSDDWSHLKRQYEGLIAQHYASNHFTYTYPVDTIGTVKITDTVSENMITGRSLIYDIKYPVKTNTVTITKPLPARRQFYLGTGLSGTTKGVIDGARLSLLYKDRKDRMFDVGGRYNVQLRNYSIEGGVFWKIKL